MTGHLLILGASVRAAAQSARRGRFEPLGADLFGDSDLMACCHAVRVTDYPLGLEQAASTFADCPWIYTGALENHPDLIDRLAARRTLYGMSGDCLRSIRDPFRVAAALARSGLQYLRVSAKPSRSLDADWVRKPLKSSGGKGIVRLPSARLKGDVDAAECYYQQFVRGRTCSALFVAAGGRSVYLGATEQLVGCRWAGARRFQYTGSLGPLRLRDAARSAFERVGACLAASFPLCGLFGVDAVIQDDSVWVLEINPRYTASVEVLERAGQKSLVHAHVAACRDGELFNPVVVERRSRVGKAILYAPRDIVVPECLHSLVAEADCALPPPELADLPEPGERIVRGHPILTVLTAGETLGGVRQNLAQQVRRLRTFLDRANCPLAKGE